MAWYRCGMNGTYNATTVSRSGAICNYVANVGGVPLSRFIANITPIQEGSGDPSPSNPRAITGWSAVHAYRSGADTTNPDTYTINLGGTYYGGTLNVGTGVLTVTRWFKQSTWGNGTNAKDLGNNTRKLFMFEAQGYNVYPPNVGFPQLCNVAQYLAKFSDDSVHFYCNDFECVLVLPDNTPNDTIVQFSGELTTPITVQLTPAQLTQLLGENNVWADSGDSEVDFFKIIRT